MEDGKRDDGLIGDVFAFGGRGFSIHNANSFTTPSAIVDSIEQVTKQYYSSVFNTAYLSDSSTPQSDREATSTLLVRVLVYSCGVQERGYDPFSLSLPHCVCFRLPS